MDHKHFSNDSPHREEGIELDGEKEVQCETRTLRWLVLIYIRDLNDNQTYFKANCFSQINIFFCLKVLTTKHK